MVGTTEGLVQWRLSWLIEQSTLHQLLVCVDSLCSEFRHCAKRQNVIANFKNRQNKRMWSDRYNYYNIQFDEKFSQKLSKATVVDYLLDTGMFKQTNHQTFTNSDKFPWVDIVLVETYDGNFAASDKENQFVTLVAIVCSKRQDIDQQVYIDTFKRIANRLNWKLYLEEDDDGNENIEL